MGPETDQEFSGSILPADKKKCLGAITVCRRGTELQITKSLYQFMHITTQSQTGNLISDKQYRNNWYPTRCGAMHPDNEFTHQ